MPRKSADLSEPNDRRLIERIEEKEENTSERELINDLIHQTHRTEAINRKLEGAENSGFVEQSDQEMLDEFKREIE